MLSALYWPRRRERRGVCPMTRKWPLCAVDDVLLTLCIVAPSSAEISERRGKQMSGSCHRRYVLTFCDGAQDAERSLERTPDAGLTNTACGMEAIRLAVSYGARREGASRMRKVCGDIRVTRTSSGTHAHASVLRVKGAEKTVSLYGQTFVSRVRAFIAAYLASRRLPRAY